MGRVEFRDPSKAYLDDRPVIANDGGSAKLIVHDIERAKQGAGEDAMAAVLDELGIYYQRQYSYSDKRRFKADFAVWMPKYPQSFEVPCVLIEIVGGVYPFKRTRKDGTEVLKAGAHGTVKGIIADIERLNEASILGWRMLRFTPQQVESGDAKAWLERLLTPAESHGKAPWKLNQGP